MAVCHSASWHPLRHCGRCGHQGAVRLDALRLRRHLAPRLVGSRCVIRMGWQRVAGHPAHHSLRTSPPQRAKLLRLRRRCRRRLASRQVRWRGLGAGLAPPRRHKRSSPRPSRSPTAPSRTLGSAPYLVSPATQDHGRGAGREVGTQPGTIGRRRPGCTLTVRTETDRYQALDAVPPSRSRRPKRTATKPPMPQARARPGDAFVLPDTAHQPPLKQGWAAVPTGRSRAPRGNGTTDRNRHAGRVTD